MSQQSPSYVSLQPGDPAPWFQQRCTSNPRYAFDTVGGRYVVLCFFASASDASAQAALADVARHREMFDDVRACFFGVSLDPADEAQGRVREQLPGIRHLWDFDGLVSKLYGSVPREAGEGTPVAARQFWIVLDPTLRVLASVPFSQDGHEQLFRFLRELPRPDRFVGFEVFAPVLVLHSVFEPALCRQLVDLYESRGGEESGFMRDVGGKTVLIQDPSHKRRRDCTIEDQQLVERLQSRILRRVSPEMRKAYSYTPTRMERYIVSCYAADDQGHFRAHRDNTTKGTAHRRFAISVNLNDDFDGGELSFPEYGGRTYKAPAGGAVVFSGALLHAVSPVTRGRRYAFLPFVYDEEAAKIREANAKFLEGEAANYKAQGPADEKA